jgi:hypothetical protein
MSKNIDYIEVMMRKQNFWFVMGLIFIVFIGTIIYMVYVVYVPKEIEWRSKIMKELCESNNMSFNKGNPSFLEEQSCYKQEGFIRTEYKAPHWWGEFNKIENQYLVEQREQ